MILAAICANVSSLEEYKDLYKITIYENQPEEYIVFGPLGAKEEIISYLDMHHPMGKSLPTKIVPILVPLVHEQFDRRDQFAIAHPKRVKESSLACKLTDCRSLGLGTRINLRKVNKRQY